MVDIEKLKKDVGPFARKHNLSLVVLFGSQVTGKTHPKSDVDIGFLSPTKPSPMKSAQLEFELARSLNIANLELVNMREVPPLILKNIATQSILLYENEQSVFSRFKIYCIKLYMEARPLIDLREASLNKFIKTI